MKKVIAFLMTVGLVLSACQSAAQEDLGAEVSQPEVGEFQPGGFKTLDLTELAQENISQIQVSSAGKLIPLLSIMSPEGVPLDGFIPAFEEFPQVSTRWETGNQYASQYPIWETVSNMPFIDGYLSVTTSGTGAQINIATGGTVFIRVESEENGKYTAHVWASWTEGDFYLQPKFQTGDIIWVAVGDNPDTVFSFRDAGQELTWVVDTN